MFEISRPDGRSNQQVIIDLVRDALPGTLFTYKQLAEQLESGTPQTFNRDRIGAIVRNANGRLSNGHKRELAAVRGEGYRLALAREQSRLASARERKGAKQYQLGLRTLKNVRLDEMTENERNAHIGHLMITSALFAQIQAIREREIMKEKADKATHADMEARLAKLEKKLTAKA